MKNPPLAHLHVAPAQTTEQSWCRFSVPLKEGEFGENQTLSVQAPDGRMCPVQFWPLGVRLDGSPTALHVVALLRQGIHRVTVEPSDGSLVSGGLEVHSGLDGSLRVNNGPDVVSFSERHLVAGLSRAGRELLGPDDFALRVETASGARGTLQEAEIGRPSLPIEGPHFVVVERWVRVRLGSAVLSFRFQFEFLSGVPGMAINVMVVHDCPGADFLDLRVIEWTMRWRKARHVVYQKCFGPDYLAGRFVETERTLDIRVDERRFTPYVENFDALEDPHEYPLYLRPPPDEIGSAFLLRNSGGILQVEMEDFHLLRPKGVRLREGGVEFAIWPEWAAPLHLRQGRRRQVRLAVFWGHETIPTTLAGLTAATSSLNDLFRGQLEPRHYAEREFFDQSRVLAFCPEKYPRLEGWLDAVSSLRTPASFFDLGDTPDTHYLNIYVPLNMARRESGAPQEGAPPLIYSTSGRTGEVYDRIDGYSPIWVNNEYDVLYALGSEYLRSANLLRWKQLRWFARHTIEVDFVCYSDHEVTHRAQPAHCFDHTSGSAYPSHFWTQGLAQYYFLTGDTDALEVIRALADKTIWYFDHPRFGQLHTGINREAGWAVLTLVAAFQATLDPRYQRYARKLIGWSMADPLPEQIPAFDFGHTSLLLGCRAYLELPDDAGKEEVFRWYLQVLDIAIQSSLPGAAAGTGFQLKLSSDYEANEKGGLHLALSRSGMLPGFAAPDCLAYAYEKTGDVRYLRAGLRTFRAFLDSNPGFGYQTFHTVIPEGKPFAMAYRTWITYLGALDRAGLLQEFDYAPGTGRFPAGCQDRQ